MKPYYLILLILLLGCQNGKDKIDDSEFKKYYEKFEILKTPIEFNNGKLIETPENDQNNLNVVFLNQIDSNLVRKYHPFEAGVINGRIFSTEKFVSIIYSVTSEELFPYLFTYTNTGEKIDSLLLNISEGLEFFSDEYCHTRIENDMTITIKDTATFYKVDPEIEFINQQPLDSIDSKIVLIQEYKITKQGKITKVHELRDTLI